jgi:hypothetical protein
MILDMLPDEDIIKLIPKTQIFLNYFFMIFLIVLALQLLGFFIQNLI